MSIPGWKPTNPSVERWLSDRRWAQYGVVLLAGLWLAATLYFEFTSGIKILP